MALWNVIDGLFWQIIDTPATTLEGWAVKARCAEHSYAFSGGLDALIDGAIDNEGEYSPAAVAFSLARDVLRVAGRGWA